MDKLLILALLMVGAVMIDARGPRGRAARKPKHGPAGPLEDMTVDICYEQEVKYTADAKNLCWFWECVGGFGDGSEIQLLPRRCALGSRMPWGYKTGLSNPCSVNFDSHVNFECTRTEDQIVVNEPACYKNTTCYNNGTAMFDGPLCWCDCLPEWKGNFDCSLKTVEVVIDETKADENATACYYQGDPPCDLAHGCENDGICHNTCGDFWCDCPVPYTNGKRCEGFSCDNNPCLNGGTCDRGEMGISEVSNCLCPAGFWGLLCEYGEAAPVAQTESAPVATESATIVTPP